MGEDGIIYVDVDVSKNKHAIAVAEGGRTGEVRYFGKIDTTWASVERLVCKLEKRYGRIHACYEAGPTGYGLHRLAVTLKFPLLALRCGLLQRGQRGGRSHVI